ncbi:hypothetical protein IW262DRAFT_651061 [Armillaria fumosa]|nr:hypothetical protein IW262DRAFT_651061 [Armillaria fumosa]
MAEKISIEEYRRQGDSTGCEGLENERRQKQDSRHTNMVEESQDNVVVLLVSSYELCGHQNLTTIVMSVVLLFQLIFVQRAITNVPRSMPFLFSHGTPLTLSLLPPPQTCGGLWFASLFVGLTTTLVVILMKPSNKAEAFATLKRWTTP